MDGAGASSAVSPPRSIPHIQSLYCHSSDLHSDAAPYRGQNQGLETAVVATSSAQGYSLTLPGVSNFNSSSTPFGTDAFTQHHENTSQLTTAMPAHFLSSKFVLVL
jgi:hypothetical protein